MKNLLISFILTISFASSAIGSDKYFCEEAYVTKLERIETNRVSRNIGQYVFVGGAIVASVFVPFVALATDLATLSTMITLPAFYGASTGIVSLLDREPGLITAKKFFEMTQLDEVELESLKQISYEKYITGTLSQRNLNDSVKVTREQVEIAYPYETFKMRTLVDSTLEYVNEKRMKKSQAELSYIEFQAEMETLLESNLFCKKRVQTYRKVLKLIKKKLVI
jgi:hypothetical protein